MNCEHIQKLILLEDSGELSERHCSAMAAHVEKCADCRSFRQMLVDVRTATRPVAEPSENVLNTIKREARKRAPESKRAKVYHLKPALAMAASVVILLGLLIVPVSRDHVGLELVMSDTELLGTQDQIVSVMYDGLSEDNLAFNFLMTYDGDM